MEFHTENITTLVKYSQGYFHHAGYSQNSQIGYDAPMIKILEYRKRRKISLAKLSELTGISEQQLNRLEKGERRWNRDNINAISRALKCTPEQLIGEENKEIAKSDDVLLSAIATLLVVLQREGVMRPKALRDAFNEIHESYEKDGNKNGQYVTADLLECIDGSNQEKISQRILRLVPQKPQDTHQTPPK